MENAIGIFEKNMPRVFHDQAAYFMSIREPKAGDALTLRLRAEKGVLSGAELCYLYGGKLVKHPMMNIGNPFDKTGKFEFFEVTFTVPEKCFVYRFRIVNKADGEWYYYTQRGLDGSNFCVSKDIPLEEEKYIGTSVWNKTAYGWQILPNFKTPDWAKGITWYSIAPDAFYNGDPTNDDTHSEGNYDQPWNISHNGLDDRYGGDLQGIMDKADYFTELGIDGVFFNPICKSNQNMGYGTTDFNQIESSFGNADKYSEFISYMHGKGLRLMHDVVIYFITKDGIYANKFGYWPKKGALKEGSEELEKDSPYYSMINDADNGGLGAWGGLTLNNYDDVTRSILYTNPTSSLARYADAKQGFGVDGYRFDCGGWITGHEGTADTYPYTPEENKSGRHRSEPTEHVMHDIRKYLKKVNPDIDLLSESSGSQLRTGCWDSQWLIGTNKIWQLFIKGEKPIKDARHSMMLTNLWSTLRGTCECSKLQVNTHDENSCARTEENAVRWRAVRLMQMTGIGSPSVYYGDETNFSGDTFVGGNGHNMKGFSYFDWDESKWDQGVNSFIRALLALRKEYPLLRTGAIEELYLDESNYDFARFDDSGAVFTMTTVLDKPSKRTLDVSAAGVADGKTVTDWLTGRQYTVKNGKINVLLPAGGTVLVTGKKSSAFRMGYFVKSVGAGKVNVTADGADKKLIFTDSAAELLGAKDKLTFVYTPAFAGVSFKADVTDGGAVMIRAGLGASDISYAAISDGDKIKVIARKRSGEAAKVIATAKAAKTVKLERCPDNTLKAYVGGKPVKGSEIKLPMNDKVFVGVTAVNGTAEVTPYGVKASGSRPLCDDFSGAVPTAMFTDVGKAKLSRGVLTVPAGNELLTRSADNDWTFKACLDYKPTTEDDYAGVVSDQDGRSFAIVGRRFSCGTVKLFFAKASDGKLVILGEQIDPHPEKKVTVQLQRIGTAYTAVYTYDGTYWKSVGTPAFLNLSLEKVGVMVCGKTDAKLDFVSFGDAINDGASDNTPHSPDAPLYGLAESRYIAHFKYRDLKGKWDYAEEGFRQSKTGEAALAVINKKYVSFRAEATLSIEKGNGFIGMSFGMTKPDAPICDAYTLRLSSDGRIALVNGTAVLGSVSAKPYGKRVRLVLEVEDGRAVVYAGQKATPVLQLPLKEYTAGYFAYCSNGVVGRVCNLNICSTNVAVYGTNRSFEAMANGIKIKGEGNTSVWIREHAYTDYVMTTTVKLDRYYPGAYSAGLLLCGSLGINYPLKDSGIYVKTEGGKLHLMQRETELAEPRELQSADSVKLTIIKQGRCLKVYVDKVKMPYFEYTLPVNCGTVWGAVSSNSDTEFTDIAVDELMGDRDPFSSSLTEDIR